MPAARKSPKSPVPKSPLPALESTGFWLVKQEPASYSWQQFVKDGKTSWTGVRNFQARNHLAAMRKGDQVFYYHSVTGKEIVGIATVAREAYDDPTADEGDWKAVDLKPLKALERPVTLGSIKADERFRDILLVRHSRISVIPLPELAFRQISEMGEK